MLFLNSDSLIILKMRVKEGNKEADILRAAIKVFAEHGFHTAKIFKIAEEANVATGSIYLYYKNKDAILATIFEQLWESFANEIIVLHGRTDITPVEKLDFLIDFIFDTFSSEPHLAVVFVNEQQNATKLYGKSFEEYDKFLQFGEKIIDDGKNAGFFNPNIDVKVLRFFLLGGVKNLLDQWAKDNKTFSLSLLRQNVKQILKRGVLI